MKAITCPQCGALVKKIPLKDKFANCDYCSAKILLPDDKKLLIEIPDEEGAKEKPELTPYEQHLENTRKARERVRSYDEPYMYPQTDEKSEWRVFLFVIAGFGAFFIIFFNSKGCLSRPFADREEKAPVKTLTSPKIEYMMPTPVPRIIFQTKVQWNGANDMEHYENPQIDTSKLPTFDGKELKKTVFKNRAVQVKITIDTNGEVISAEAVSGHPILKEAAVNAARKTIFNPRRKPTSRVLTYYFHLTDE